MIALAMAATGLLAGCSALSLGTLFGAEKPAQAEKPGPTRLEAILVGSSDINPDLHGRPSPVLVRVFVLKNTALFDSAEMISLFEHEREALAADLVDKEDVAVKPDESRALERTLAPEATALGFAVAYRDVHRAAWRVTVPLRAGERNRLVVRLDGIRVSVATPRAAGSLGPRR